MDPVSVFNPSVFHQEQYNPNDEEDQAELERLEAEEQRQLEAGVEAELANMTGPDFDDSEEESVLDDQNRPEGSYAVHVPQPMGHSYANPRNFTENDEQQILYGQESGHLQVLYHARGEEMSRLNDKVQELNAQMEGDSRAYKHQLTLLKQKNGQLESNCEHFESVAKAQSEENAKLRQDLELLKGQNTKSYNENSQLKSEIESQNMMVQTLQIQIQELQRSDTILRQKTQHEEKLRSMTERHESEMFQMQQQVDKLDSETRKLDAEKEVLSSKLRKNQSEFDKINLEKSDTIKNLQERLDLSQRKIDQIQASKSTYTDGTEMFKRYQIDKEKFAMDLCDKQEEIERLKSLLKTKTDASSKLKVDFENQIGHKDNLISSLNQRLNESERKISELMRESLSGSTNAAVRRLKDELEKVKTEMSKKDLELVTMKSNLDESKLKYSDFKKRVRLYQNDRKKKEEKLKEYIKESEEEFRAKLRAARDQMQADYDAKLSEVSNQLANTYI